NPTIKAHEANKNQTPARVTSGSPDKHRPTGPVTPAWTYDYSSSSVEFHKFLPALADMENSMPLLRFTKLTLTSPQEPFFMEATALNINGSMSTLRAGPLSQKKAGR